MGLEERREKSEADNSGNAKRHLAREQEQRRIVKLTPAPKRAASDEGLCYPSGTKRVHSQRLRLRGHAIKRVILYAAVVLSYMTSLVSLAALTGTGWRKPKLEQHLAGCTGERQPNQKGRACGRCVSRSARRNPRRAGELNRAPTSQERRAESF